MAMTCLARHLEISVSDRSLEHTQYDTDDGNWDEHDSHRYGKREWFVIGGRLHFGTSSYLLEGSVHKTDQRAGRTMGGTQDARSEVEMA
jgi:hypothetical protein